MKQERNAEILNRFAAGETNMSRLARDYGVSRQRIEQIINIDKARARGLFAKEAITPHDACQVCGSSDDVVTAHHFDYGKPLEVIWVCTMCHPVIDKARRRREVAIQTKQAAPDLLSTTEAAMVAGVTPQNFANWVRRYRVRCVTRRGFRFFRKQEIEKGLARMASRAERARKCKAGHLLLPENRNAQGQCRACIAVAVRSIQGSRGRAPLDHASTHAVRNGMRIAGLPARQITNMRFEIDGHLSLTRGHRSPWILKQVGSMNEIGRASSLEQVVALVREALGRSTRESVAA